MMGHQSTIPKKCWQHSPPDSISCFSLWSHGWRGATAHQRWEYCITYHWPRKRPKFRIWSMASTEDVLLSRPCSVKKTVSQTIMIQETSVLEPRFSPAPPSTKHHINQVGNPAGAKKWNQYCTKSPKSSISTTQTNHCQRPTWQREQGKKKTQGHAGTRFPLLSPSRSSSSSARHTCTDCANCLWGHWREQLATC